VFARAAAADLALLVGAQVRQRPRQRTEVVLDNQGLEAALLAWRMAPAAASAGNAR
jgi:hypothetical protein